MAELRSILDPKMRLIQESQSGYIVRMTHRRIILIAGGALLTHVSFSSCAPAAMKRAPTNESEPVNPAPWRGPTLSRGTIPAVYVTEWRKADNRITCALLAPAALGAGMGATPRAATFSGGWAVAYDKGDTRSAFGVAGTATKAADRGPWKWPYDLRWADGSNVGYGPEGGTGPNELAYLEVRGQQCLYNVWSRLGRHHLEHLLSQLRFVDLNNRQ